MKNKELLLELEKQIKAGQIKIEWEANGDNYNEEDNIIGLLAKNGSEWVKVDLYEYYQLFPCNKEKKEVKPESWRSGENAIEFMKDKNNKAFFENEMRQVERDKNCGGCPVHCRKEEIKDYGEK